MSSPHHRRQVEKKEEKSNKTHRRPVAGTSEAHEDTSSGSISSSRRSNSLKEETISDYIYFHIRIQTILSQLKGLDSSEQIVLLFTGSELPHTQQTWCNDCNYLDGILANYMRRAKHITGYLVRVKVGDSDEWRDPSNPYRTDPNIRLKSIPTLMVWNSGKRLSGDPIFEIDQLVALFDENIVVKPGTETAGHRRFKNRASASTSTPGLKKKAASSTFRTTR